MKWSGFTDKTDNRPKPHDDDWLQIAEKFARRHFRTEKDGPLFSPASFKPGSTRGKENVVEVSMLVLDFDKGHDHTQFTDHWAELGLAFVVYSTFSHSPEFPKWRAVFPIETAVEGPAWPDFWARANEHLASGLCDPACKDASRIYYTPASEPGKEAEAFTIENVGRFLRSDDLPALPQEEEPEVRRQSERLTRNFDDFVSWDELMYQAGGHSPRKRGPYTYWWRPGKSPKDGPHSARTGQDRHGEGFYNWSSEWTEVPLNQRKDKFGLWVHLNYGGTSKEHFRQAFEDLKAMGVKVKDEPERPAKKDPAPVDHPRGATYEETPFGSFATPVEPDDASYLNSALKERKRPQIQTTFVQYRDTMDAVYSAIVERNDPPVLFVRNGTLAMVARHGEGDYKIVDAMDHDVRAMAAQACDFVKWSEKKNGMVPCDPPGKVEAMVRAKRPWPGIPALEGLSQCPVLRSDDKFARDVGYDDDTKSYITEGPWPVHSGATSPISMLADEMLGEFPFENEASRDNALALCILPFVRRIISSPTPVHYIDAPIAGTGKTALSQACLYAACGFVGASTLPEREEERKKAISSFLLEGAPAIIWDNVDKRVDSGTLAAATTNARYHDRMLGSNAVIDVPVKCVWVMTGNNAELNRDMVRRTVWIRIDAKMERPSQGRKFSKDIMQWCASHRRELVAACCQVVQNWCDEGKPMFTERGMGGFEAYCQIVGGILLANGRSDFLANQDGLEKHADTDSSGWSAFYGAVYENRRGGWWKVSEILETAAAIDELAGALGSNESGSKLRFGRALKKREGTVAAGVRLIIGTDPLTKQTVFRLAPTEGHDDYDPYADDVPIPGQGAPEPQYVQTGLPYKDE